MILGIDVSHHQLEMDWYKARNAGAKYAFIRAGSITEAGGQCYTDYQFDRNSRIAPDYLPVGYYWYFRPQYDPVMQANYFCQLIRQARWKLPPVLDLETIGGKAAFEITDAALKFMYQVFNRLDIWPILYSRALWLNSNTINDDKWDQTGLWVARYKSSLVAPWSDGYCKPNYWDDWLFWQYSADGNGQGPKYGAKSKSIDIDFFNGDEKDLAAYIGEPKARAIRITSPLAASLRSSQEEGAAIGATWRGSVWPVVADTYGYYKVECWIEKSKAEEI